MQTIGIGNIGFFPAYSVVTQHQQALAEASPRETVDTRQSGNSVNCSAIQGSCFFLTYLNSYDNARYNRAPELTALVIWWRTTFQKEYSAA